MQAEPRIMLGALVLLALLVGGVVLLVLFLFKSTRPAAWTLLGLGVLLVLFVFGYASLSERRVVESNYHRRAQEQAYAQWLQSQARDAGEAPVDVERLLGPRIAMDEAGEAAPPAAPPSAHAGHSPPPLAIAEAIPPEPAAEAAFEEAATEEESKAAPADTAGTLAASSRPALIRAANQDRPAWVDQAPTRDGNSYPVVIVTDPHAKRQQAERQVSELIVVKTVEVLSDMVGRSLVDDPYDLGPDRNYQIALHELHRLGLTPGMVRNRVWRDEYIEHSVLELPSGEYAPLAMMQIHTLLSYDQSFQDDLQQRWRQSQAKQRLGAIGVISGSVLGLLALAWGVLKFDTMTKGYYTKWLLLGGGVLATITFLTFLALV